MPPECIRPGKSEKRKQCQTHQSQAAISQPEKRPLLCKWQANQLKNHNKKWQKKNIYMYVCMYVDAKKNVGGEKVKGKNVEGKSAVLAKMENDVKCKLTAFNINSKTIGELHAREMKCQRERSKINFPRHECIRQRRQPYNLSIPLSLFRAFSLTERSPCNTSTSFD